MNPRLQQELEKIDRWFAQRLQEIEEDWQAGLYTGEQADNAEQVAYTRWLEASIELEEQYTTSL